MMKSRIIPWVMTWNGIITKAHKIHEGIKNTAKHQSIHAIYKATVTPGINMPIFDLGTRAQFPAVAIPFRIITKHA